MSTYQYDLTIIGGGSAGLPAAQMSAALGARTLLVDKERLGGDCLHTGCVPSKALIHAARIVHQARQAAQFGLKPSDMLIDMARVRDQIQSVIAEIGRLEEESYVRDVEVRFGKVSFHSPHQLELNGEIVTTRAVLLCMGSRAAPPPIPGLAESGYLTNEDVFDLEKLPASFVIIGGGPTGVELGQAFNRLGCKVTILEAQPWLLPQSDAETCDELYEILESEGLTLATNAAVESVRCENGRKVVTVVNAGELREFAAEQVLVAAGRKPNVEGLNLEEVGLHFDAQGIKVDGTLRTNVKNIFAAGDVIGGQNFTHLAATEASTAVLNALAPPIRRKMSYRVIPWVTFTDPEVAAVGLTEAQAREKFDRVRVLRFPWQEIDRAQTDGVTQGFIKLVLAGKLERLVGAHLIGAGAGELLPELAMVMQQRKGLDAIVYTMHAYPTLAIGLQQAAFRSMQSSDSWRYLRKGLSPVLRALALCFKQCETSIREAFA